LKQSLAQQISAFKDMPMQKFEAQFMPQFTVICQLDNFKEKAAEVGYDEPFNDGAYIQANTKKITVTLFWTYKPTGEFVVLATRDVEPTQQLPSVGAGEAFAVVQTVDAPVKKLYAFNKSRKARMAASVQNVRFEIKNIAIEFSDIPIDILDQYSGKQLKAKIEDIEPFGEPKIEFDHPETALSVSFSTNDADIEPWTFSSETVRVVETKYVKDDAKYFMTIELRGVPVKNGNEKRIIKGKLAITAGAKLTNPNSGKSVTGNNTLIIPINLEY
jgi:hypothetical protein